MCKTWDKHKEHLEKLLTELRERGTNEKDVEAIQGALYRIRNLEDSISDIKDAVSIL